MQKLEQWDTRRDGQAITLLTWLTRTSILRPASLFSFLDPLCGDPRDLTGFNSITAGGPTLFFATSWNFCYAGVTLPSAIPSYHSNPPHIISQPPPPGGTAQVSLVVHWASNDFLTAKLKTIIEKWTRVKLAPAIAEILWKYWKIPFEMAISNEEEK